jgi:hypothetical protein
LVLLVHREENKTKKQLLRGNDKMTVSRESIINFYDGLIKNAICAEDAERLINEKYATLKQFENGEIK